VSSEDANNDSAGPAARLINVRLDCLLEAGQSTYVPQQTRHRLANPGPEALEVVEVQPERIWVTSSAWKTFTAACLPERARA
jgi:hypothetical protein